jgi:hypothetical protein
LKLLRRYAGYSRPQQHLFNLRKAETRALGIRSQ